MSPLARALQHLLHGMDANTFPAMRSHMSTKIHLSFISFYYILQINRTSTIMYVLYSTPTVTVTGTVPLTYMRRARSSLSFFLSSTSWFPESLSHLMGLAKSTLIYTSSTVIALKDKALTFLELFSFVVSEKSKYKK